jgi:hypothetical protein|tara:strand:- start:15127 stop:15360 length:234 start_codon:yes stop_codon:yes gene_type:complete
MSEAKQEAGTVSNLNQAISVLMQAAEQGRRAGIFEWEDLDYISQSLKLLNAYAKEQEQAPSEPTTEPTEVILEPTKD